MYSGIAVYSFVHGDLVVDEEQMKLALPERGVHT
jgi:hypothetical protein